jgi:hypothetical protein
MFSSSSPTLLLPLPACFCLLRQRPSGHPPSAHRSLSPPRRRYFPPLGAGEPLASRSLPPPISTFYRRGSSRPPPSLSRRAAVAARSRPPRGRLPCARFGSRRGGCGRGRSGRSTGGGGSRRGGGGARARRCGVARQSSFHRARCERGRWVATAELHPLPLLCGGWLREGTLRGGLEDGKRGRRKEWSKRGRRRLWRSRGASLQPRSA